jgi:hypothetical protein
MMSMLKDGYRKSSFKKDKQLWVPYHLLKCPDVDLKKAKLDDTASNGEVNLAVEAFRQSPLPDFW